MKPRKHSELQYQPTDRMMKASILPWDKLPKKECFLDKAISDAKGKLDPGQYKGHDKWTDDMSSIRVNGHVHKGQFLPHDRKLEA